MSDNNYFRNTNRTSGPIRAEQQEKFQPQYIRHGIEPLQKPNFPIVSKNKRPGPMLKSATPAIQSGNGFEHTWNQLPLDNNSASEISEREASRQFRDNEVADPRRTEQYSVEKDSEEIVSFPNQFVIFFNGTPYIALDSLAEVESRIEKLMFDSDSKIQGVSIEDFEVYQKLDLRFGISVK